MRSFRAIPVVLLFVIGAMLLSGPAIAAEFPTKPITLIVPYPAGGSTDVVIRPLAEAAGKILGQPMLVENKGGGGGAVGTGSIIGKEPDGYLLSVVVTSLHRAAHINKLAFDTVKDVSPIIRVAGYLYGVLVKPDSKNKTLKDLIDFAKATPGQATYMASGIGTGGHIAAEEMASNAGVKFNHLPSKGDQESSAALLGGHVDFISTTSGWIPLVEAGQLKLIAVYGDTRVKRFPDVPTVKESGYKVVHDSPIGIVGPKGMAPERVKAPARRLPEGPERSRVPQGHGQLRDAGAVSEHRGFHQVLGRGVCGGRGSGQKLHPTINIEKNLPHHPFRLDGAGAGRHRRGRSLGLRNLRPAGAGVPAFFGGGLPGRSGRRRPDSDRSQEAGRRSRPRLSHCRRPPDRHGFRCSCSSTCFSGTSSDFRPPHFYCSCFCSGAWSRSDGERSSWRPA